MLHRNVILDYVLSNQKKNEGLSGTLLRLLADKKYQNNLLTKIIQNPRDNKSAYRSFLSAFQGRKQKWRFLSIYNNTYADFMNGLLKKSGKIEDILKIIPNLSPWTLEQRFGSIEIGKIPADFTSKEQFLSLVTQIRSSRAVQVFKRIKRLECHLDQFQKAFPKVQKIDWFDFSARSDFLRKLMKEKCGKSFMLHQGKKVYRITFLCNPYSNKMVFEVVPKDKRKFILKLAPYSFLTTPNDRVRKEHENMAIRADSTYSDAFLEFYLKLNDCPHAPHILYYHFNHEVALYLAEEGVCFHQGKNKAKYLDFYSFNTKVIPDSMRLGVYVNDINPGNFMMSAKDKTVKIIDIGHATFANPLTPGVPGLTFTLGNLCGQDYISVNGVLGMEDI